VIAPLLAAALLAGPAQAQRPPPRSALAEGRGSVSAEVKPNVHVRLRVEGASVEVAATDGSSLTVSVPSAPALPLRLVSLGAERVEPEFDGKAHLQRGKLVVSVPRGASLDVSTVGGSVAIRGLQGAVRVRALSAAVEVAEAGEVDIETVDGPIALKRNRGPMRVHTVSGATNVTARAGTRLELESAAGGLDWDGPCAAGCHIDADTVSGHVALTFDEASSFELAFGSHGGKLVDEVLLVRRDPARQKGPDTWTEASLGDAAGAVEIETFSGNLTLRKRTGPRQP